MDTADCYYLVEYDVPNDLHDFFLVEQNCQDFLLPNLNDILRKYNAGSHKIKIMVWSLNLVKLSIICLQLFRLWIYKIFNL